MGDISSLLPHSSGANASRERGRFCEAISHTGQATMRKRTYPGRLTREEWLKRPVDQRSLLAARAQSDLLSLWRSCDKKPCRRAHACRGDEQCRMRPRLADLNNPNRGRPDFRPSYRIPEELNTAYWILDSLPHRSWTPEAILRDGALASVRVQALLRRIFKIEPRRLSGKSSS
jgi:hypothetical protein